MTRGLPGGWIDDYRITLGRKVLVRANYRPSEVMVSDNVPVGSQLERGFVKDGKASWKPLARKTELSPQLKFGFLRIYEKGWKSE